MLPLVLTRIIGDESFGYRRLYRADLILGLGENFFQVESLASNSQSVVKQTLQTFFG